MDYQLRLAVSGDYSYCYRLSKRNMSALFGRHWGGWAPGAFRKAFRVENTRVVMMGGRRAGYLSVRPEAGAAYLENIQLSARWRGKGIGTQLLTRLIAEHPTVSLRLTTFDDSPAKRLYERLGFVVVERHGMTLHMERPPAQPGGAQAWPPTRSDCA